MTPARSRPEPAQGSAAAPSGRARLWRQVASLAAWWLLLTLALWLLGLIVDQPAGFWACAASAALLVAIGEAGASLRSWVTSRRGREGKRG
ncbi:hypothetical protein [Streptomyces sp. MAA16]|uniref:hypothetical protein n=1 Tax=Streptomyces sp. MAA16 TaxID=3035116 RepID=UPI002474F249|nr:hypothetical protein [Streptomyces sp. MAA16]MDH6697462.1 hypothetical protein [Streptomyces sp. MAA16]